MCLTWFWFETFKLDGGHVILGNNKSRKILEIGSIRLRMFNGIEKILQDVRYILELRRNLIYLVVLDQFDYTFKSESKTLKITKEFMIIMKEIIKNGLYTLVGKTVIR